MYVTDDPEIYVKVIGRMMITRCCNLSALTFFVWDWLTHLDDEVRFVWRPDWKSAGKPLYLFLRYFGMLFQAWDLMTVMTTWSLNYCRVAFWVYPMGTLTFLGLVDILLAHRAACLYPSRFRVLLFVNMGLLALTAVVTTVILGITIPWLKAVPAPKYLTGCWATQRQYEFISTVPPLIFEIWLFGMIVYKVYLYWVDFNGLPKIGMVRLLIQDQINWFFVVAAVITWNGLQMGIAPPGLRGIAAPAFRSITCICGCRLVLHTRKTYLSNRATTGGGSADFSTLHPSLWFHRTTVAEGESTEDKGRSVTKPEAGVDLKTGNDVDVVFNEDIGLGEFGEDVADAIEMNTRSSPTDLEVVAG